MSEPVLDLEALARQAVRAIVALTGPGNAISKPNTNNGVPRGLSMRSVEFFAGEEDKAVEALAKDIHTRGIRRFVIRKVQDLPQAGAHGSIVTEDGVSVRAICQHDIMKDADFYRLDVLGMGA